MTTATINTQRLTLNLRIKEDVRDLIDRAKGLWAVGVVWAVEPSPAMTEHGR